MAKKFIKKLGKMAAIVTAVAVALSAVPFATAEAKGETWTHPGDGWSYLEGTDVKVKLDGDALIIKGTGSIPDYDGWSLEERPWNNSDCQYLIIDNTIESIGNYAFCNLTNLKYIFIGTNTFVSDAKVFNNIGYEPVFRITECGEQTKMYGTIPFTSLESLERMAQTNWFGASYVLDTPALAKAFQESVNPTVTNVYYAGDENAPWNYVEDNGNGGVATPVCSVNTPGLSKSYGASAQRQFLGDACYEAFAAFIGDYSFATTYNIVVTNGQKKVTNTDTELIYTLTIPEEYRLPGRSFRLLAIGEGVVNIYDDLDASDATITFSTAAPTTAYALVYK